MLGKKLLAFWVKLEGGSWLCEYQADGFSLIIRSLLPFPLGWAVFTREAHPYEPDGARISRELERPENKPGGIV